VAGFFEHDNEPYGSIKLHCLSILNLHGIIQTSQLRFFENLSLLKIFITQC